jgi:asparaginyl-tRNA synthetase
MTIQMQSIEHTQETQESAQELADAPTVYISELSKHEGETVTVRGWLMHHRDKKKLQFLVVRDGTGTVQAVAFQDDLSPDAWQRFRDLTQESSLVITGSVRKDDRAPGGYELSVKDLQVFQAAAPDYPIAPKEHGVGFLMEHRHLWIRSTKQRAVLRIRAEVVKAARDYLDSNGYVLVDTPILTPAACEGTSTLFETDYFGTPAFLAQSGQLYNEANIEAFGKVYCFGPTFRAEKSKTRRHLMEFWMVEPEAAWMELPGLLELEEGFVSSIVQTVLKNRRAELETLERDISRLENVQAPFPRITYDRAVEILNENGLDVKWGDDFGGDEETVLASQYDRPLFITHYPAHAKAFYMQPDPQRRNLRRFPAHPRPRPDGAAHWGAQLAEGCVRVVPGPAQVWQRAPRGLRHGRGACGRLDMRHTPPARDYCLPQDAGQDLPVKGRTRIGVAASPLRRFSLHLCGSIRSSSLVFRCPTG